MKMTKIFLSVEKEEKWLNHMSDEGHRFVGRRGFSYQFEPCEKGTFRYYIDQRGWLKDNGDFVAFLNQCNLNLAARQWGFYYFEGDKSSSAERIYSDIKSKIYFYLRCILWLAVIGIINISIMNQANGPYLLNVSIPFVVNSVVLCLVIVTVLKHVRNIFLLIISREC